MRSFTTIKEMEAKRSLTNSRYTKFHTQSKRCSQLNNDELTVRTPFTNVKSKLRPERLSQTFNMANPNPQNGDWIFKGARDVGYQKFFEGKNPLTDVVRFGKKVDYYSKVTNDQLMQDHLRQIRDKMSHTSNQKQLRRQQEKEFLD